jgi:hypothetical protein
VWGVLEEPSFKSAWACCLGEAEKGGGCRIGVWGRRSAEAATLLVGLAGLWLRLAGDRPELRAKRENILFVRAQKRESRTA